MALNKNYWVLFVGTVAILIFSGCTKHEVDIKPVEIKPIHITIDINVKVDRALDDFFGDLDAVPAK
jgi:hypothetical protein